MDGEYSLALLGLNANAIVYEDGIGGKSRKGKKILLSCIRAHRFFSMFYLHRFEKRTV